MLSISQSHSLTVSQSHSHTDCRQYDYLSLGQSKERTKGRRKERRARWVRKVKDGKGWGVGARWVGMGDKV
jgi:hypothetical protein